MNDISKVAVIGVGFTITSIVSDNEIRHPQRCCVAHYFQPAYFLPLVEIVGGEKTSKETLERTCEILSAMHKKPVLIPGELPSHVGNRIQYAIGRRMVNTGWFIRNDLIGLDFIYNAAKAAGKEPWEPFKERVKRGDLGMKSGKGFYEWPDFGEAVNEKQHMELMRLLKEDIETGKM